MSKPIERIERLTSKDTHPFDFVFRDTDFYDPKPEEGTEFTERLRAQTKVAYVAANSVSRGIKLAFVPGSMSNGYHAYELAEDYKDKILRNTESRTGTPYLTTQRLKHNVPKSELLNRVILPYRIQNHIWSDQVEIRKPDFAAVGPVDFEGPIRVMVQNHALALGASFQDWTFESWWGPRVIDSDAMVLAGDHAYSRYANVEEALGDLIQTGLLDTHRDHVSPGKEYDITDIDGQAVTLSDRAWETSKHIMDVTERGFRTDLAVAALIVRFQIDDWLNDPANSPLDMATVHPVLAERTQEDKDRMARLKEIMLPYLAEKCISWLPYQGDQDLRDYVENNILPAAERFDEKAVKKQFKELFAHQPVGGFVHPKYSAPQTGTENSRSIANDFSNVSRKVKRRSTEGEYFSRKSNLFEDSHYEKLDTWEQAGISFALGAMEGHRLPETHSQTLFYACEPKGGERARAWADKRNIDWLAEAESFADPVASDDTFYKQVMVRNIAEAEVVQENLAKTASLQGSEFANVVSTLDMLQVREVMAKYREFVATPGPENISSRGFLAMQMEWFDRNAQALVLREGWENHPREVQMVVRAVLHATGQIERPYDGGKHRMSVFLHDADTDTLQKQDLYDLVTTLAATVEKQLDQSPPVPNRAQYVAMARLLELADKLIDPASRNYMTVEDKYTGDIHNHAIVDWGRVDSDFIKFSFDGPEKRKELTATQKGEEESLRDRLRRKIFSSGVFAFDQSDLEGLDQDYHSAWIKVHGADLYEKRTEPPIKKIITPRNNAS